jgi:predicted CopG family antitoxin
VATKTITIDLEAYRRLKGAKKEGESFSQTIKRVVRPPVDLCAWLREIERHPMSRSAMDAVEGAVRGRSVPTRRRR